MTEKLALSSETLRHPLYWWQFLTYGFVHDPASIMHIVANMLGLFFLGRTVEQVYGSKEFLRVYIVMLLLGSISFALGNAVSSAITHKEPYYTLLGASGAVSGHNDPFRLEFPPCHAHALSNPYSHQSLGNGRFNRGLQHLGHHCTVGQHRLQCSSGRHCLRLVLFPAALELGPVV